MRRRNIPSALRLGLAVFARRHHHGRRKFSTRGSVIFVAHLIIAALPVTCAWAQAQVKPDFSGRWIIPGGTPANTVILNKGGEQEPGMSNGWGHQIAIGQDEVLLTVKFDFFTSIDLQPPIRFRYALNGTKTTNSVMMGRGIERSTSTAFWHGDTLVIKTEQSFHNPDTGLEESFEVTRRLSLESPGQLRVETTFGGVLGGPPTVTSTKYTRGSQPP